jgi:hypothetical protein
MVRPFISRANKLLGENMKRYRGVVVFRYYQTIEVEAENADQAMRLMYDQYDDSRADGESDVLDVEEIKE